MFTRWLFNQTIFDLNIWIEILNLSWLDQLKSEGEIDFHPKIPVKLRLRLLLLEFIQIITLELPKGGC